MNDKEYRMKVIDVFVKSVKSNDIDTQLSFAELVDYMFIDFNGDGMTKTLKRQSSMTK